MRPVRCARLPQGSHGLHLLLMPSGFAVPTSANERVARWIFIVPGLQGIFLGRGANRARGLGVREAAAAVAGRAGSPVRRGYAQLSGSA